MTESELFSLSKMQNPFEAIKDTDASGREWCNSRRLARLMIYQKYWNIERLKDKPPRFCKNVGRS